MKKLIYSMFALAISAMTFVSCEDVPMPYSLDGDGTENTDPSGNDGNTSTAIEVSCTEAIDYVNALADGATSTETYAVTGYITEVVGSVSSNQQTFWMADTKDGGKVFEAYYANLPEGVSAFKKGAKVKITGKLTKYVNSSTGNVTPEIKNATVEILEDADDATPTTAKEVSCAEAVEQTNALADGATSSETYAVTGYITEVVGSVSKNQQIFWMADSKDGGKVFEAYYANLPEGVSAFTKGSKVKITGQLTKFVNKSTGNVTPEIKNADVEILEAADDSDNTGGETGGETSGGATMSKTVDGLSVTFTNPNATAGESVTYDLTTCGLAHQTENPSFTLENVSFTFAQGDGSTTPKYWKTGNYDEFRMYAKNVLTIVGTSNIASVVFQCVNNNNNPAVGNEQAYATVNGKTLTFTNDWTSASAGTQFRFKSVTITYAK